MELYCPSLLLEEGTVRVNGREQFSDSWQKTEVYLHTLNDKSLLVIEEHDINDGVATEIPSWVTLYGMLEDHYYFITLRDLSAVPDLTMFEDLHVTVIP
jgi:phosphoribosyl 1,2-cyclic phosphodiesterase